MSQLKNIDTSLLGKFLSADLSPVPDPPATKDPAGKLPAAAPGKKKNKAPRPRHGVHQSFSDSLMDDPGWLYERVGKLLRPNLCQLITVLLQRQLWEQGHNFVIKGLTYQNSEMDIITITNDQVNEFEIKTDRVDFARDFKKCIFMGRAINKHGLLKAGKAITNRFWFVCPTGLIDEDHLPDYCGLMYFLDKPIGEKQFQIIREAPLLHSERVTPGFYKTLAGRLYDRYINMVKKYQHSSVINSLLYGKKDPPETNIDQAEHISADTHPDHPGRSEVFPDSGGSVKGEIPQSP